MDNKLPSSREWSVVLKRNQLLTFAALVCTVLSLTAQVDLSAPSIWLEVPSLHLRVDAEGAAVVPTSEFDSLVIHLGRQPSQVNYGSIFTKINTESANIIMTTTSTADGIMCRFDLSLRGGFRLVEGRNSVEIAFNDQMQRLHYASFLLQVTESPLLLTPPSSERPEKVTATKYALVVGISKYANGGGSGGLHNLQFADRDAETFRDFLISPMGGGFRRENIRYLVNENATSRNLRSALFTFMTQPHAEDLVVIYFAGHGFSDPHDRRNLYLATYDTDPNDMGGTAFPMWQLQDVFTRIIKARRVITFTDSCHSYGISGAMNTVNYKANNLVNQYLAKYAGDADRAVITASGISELSYESDRWGGGHGVFTFYLLKGLKGEADLNHDGTVTAGELFVYVQSHVREATGGAQTPEALPGLAELLPLSETATRDTAPATTSSPHSNHGP